MSFSIQDVGSATKKFGAQYKLYSVTISPAISQTWSIIVYDSATQAGTILLQQSGVSGTTQGPIQFTFPRGLEARTGLSYTLTQISQVTFELE